MTSRRRPKSAGLVDEPQFDKLTQWQENRRQGANTRPVAALDASEFCFRRQWVDSHSRTRSSIG